MTFFPGGESIDSPVSFTEFKSVQARILIQAPMQSQPFEERLGSMLTGGIVQQDTDRLIDVVPPCKGTIG